MLKRFFVVINNSVLFLYFRYLILVIYNCVTYLCSFAIQYMVAILVNLPTYLLTYLLACLLAYLLT